MLNAYETHATAATCFPALGRDREFQPGGTCAPGLTTHSQPHDQAIEYAIGARLFNRDTRNVELTSVGAELRPIAVRLVKEFDSAFSELSQFVEGQRGSITVAALPSIAAVLLPSAIARFRETNPGVDIAVRDSLSQQVLNSVFEGTADLGITVHPAPSARLAYKPLVADEFCLVCRKDDPRPARKRRLGRCSASIRSLRCRRQAACAR